MISGVMMMTYAKITSNNKIVFFLFMYLFICLVSVLYRKFAQEQIVVVTIYSSVVIQISAGSVWLM